MRHIKFGVGTVKDIVEGGRDYEVTVEFDTAGVKKMFATFCKVKKGRRIKLFVFSVNFSMNLVVI